MAKWKCALELDQKRNRIGGSESALCEAVSRGADLRIETAFKHNEHIDTKSGNDEWVREVSEFRVTYLLENRWAAGFMTLRQPVTIPEGFGPRPSLSLFMYNQNGQQAIARPYLDGAAGGLAEGGVKAGGHRVAGGLPGAVPDTGDHAEMPLYHQLNAWDVDMNAPSSNFIYDFGFYRYWVNDEWEEVLSHDAEGGVVSGSLEALVAAFQSGREVKVGIRGICADLADGWGGANGGGHASDASGGSSEGGANGGSGTNGGSDASDASGGKSLLDHELFVQVGFTYYYTESKLFLGETHPIVRVKPAIPVVYESGNWDYGWAMPRTDGFAALLLLDPYTLEFHRKEKRYPMRWFVR